MEFDIWKYEFSILYSPLRYQKFIPLVISDIRGVFRKVKTNIRYEFDWFHSHTWIEKYWIKCFLKVVNNTINDNKNNGALSQFLLKFSIIIYIFILF